MTEPSAERGVFSRADRIRIGLLTGAFVLAVAALGCRSLADAERERIDDAAAATLHAGGQRVVEMRGVMKAMLGMHYASDEFAGNDIAAFAEQLRRYSDFIDVMGMFTLLDADFREQFARFMSVETRGDFRISDWTAAAERIDAPVRAQHLPINRIDPLDGAGLALLGTDLHGAPGIERALRQAVGTGEPFLSPVPPDWPLSGDLMILQPVYASARPPVEREERLASWIGGVWYTLDLSALLGRELAGMPLAEVSLSMTSAAGAPSALMRRAPTREPLGWTLGFEAAGDERSWSIGRTVLSMSVRQPVRLAPEHLWRIGALVSAALLLAGTLIAYAHQRRVMHRQREDAAAALTAERDKVTRTLESIGDAVLTMDEDGRVLYLNPSAARMVGTARDAVGHPVDALLELHELRDGRRVRTRFEALVARLERQVPEPSPHGGGSARGEPILEIDVLSGENAGTGTLALTLSRLLAPSTGYLCVLQDVSKERELTAELQHRAHHDAMTGCFNRFYFERRLEELVGELDRCERRHALCSIDLDRFKIVNDTCGHAAGDRLLCELTEALTSLLREGDVLARLGGDEFGVIICDVTEEQAHRVAQTLHAHFKSAMFSHEGNLFPVRASMGLAEIGERNRDAAQIVKAADIACYAAKDGGRNALVVYSEDDAAMAQRQEETNWLPVLERALAEDRFRLLFQPIASVRPAGPGTAGGFDIGHHELLLRLVDDEGREVRPLRFIKAAERYDLMRAIDRWVIERTMRTIAAEPDRFDPSLTFSINVSGQSMADPELLAFIAGMLEELSLAPSRFWFEIGETAAISNIPSALALIDGLHALGARVALDDVGSGPTSFAYLRDLPVDVLKIDGQFVVRIAEDPVSREMLRAMVQVAGAMSMRTVAEFVEDEPTMRELDALGVDMAQGWHVGEPVDVDTAFPPAAALARVA